MIKSKIASLILIALFTTGTLSPLGSQALADAVSTRIVTDNEFDRSPVSVHVNWIGWDSSFRNSGLQIGDHIVAVSSSDLAGGFMRLDESNLKNGTAPGGYAEETFWNNAAAMEGDSLELTVLRDGKEITIPGVLTAEKFYYTSTNRRALGDNGPDQMSNSGLPGSPWSFWYEDFIKKASYVLDDAWNKNSTFNNQRELKEWLEQNEERVRYLVANHPGNFTSAVAADFETVRSNLIGEKVTVTPSSQEWRKSGAQSLHIAKEVGLERMAAIKKENPSQWIRTFPAPHPITTGNLARWMGKWIELPKIKEQDSITDLGNTYFVSGNSNDGYWIVPGKTPLMDQFFDTFFQFQSLYSSQLSMELYFYAKITPEAKMVQFKGRTITAFVVEPFAGYVGDRSNDLDSKSVVPGYFIDLRQQPSIPVAGSDRLRIPFAGEEKVPRPELSTPTANSSPGEVMTLLIRAIQFAKQDLWQSLFADWDFYEQKPYPPVFIPNNGYNSGTFRINWDQARALLTNFEDQRPDVVDVRVSREFPPVRIFEGDPVRGIPPIDETKVYVDHIIRVTPDSTPDAYDGEFRVFTNMYVRRVWRLQRLGPSAPWKISEMQAL